MATAAQVPVTPPTTDPIQRWLARRGAVAELHADQHDANMPGSPAPTSHAPNLESQSLRRAATNRANSRHSTGPRTEPASNAPRKTPCAMVSPAPPQSCPPRTPKPTSATSSNFSMSTPPPPPPRPNSSTKSPTPPGDSIASRSSKPPCSRPKPPTDPQSIPNPAARAARHAWPPRLSPLPSVSKSHRAVPLYPGRAPPPGATPAH